MYVLQVDQHCFEGFEAMGQSVAQCHSQPHVDTTSCDSTSVSMLCKSSLQ